MKKNIKVAWVLGTLGLSGLGLTGCNKKLNNAQSNLNEIVLNELNASENSKINIGGDFSSYPFLGSNVEKQDESYIFDKFIECVNSKQKDNYSVTLESCDDYKDLTAFNFDYEKCIEK